MKILFYLLLAFIVLPLVELLLLFGLVKLTDYWLAAIGLIILTGMIGAALAKRQGWQAWTQIQRALVRGEMPGREILDAFLILIAGALLITPGILSDLVGFLLLLPTSRRHAGNLLIRYFKKRLNITNIHAFPKMGPGATPGPQAVDDNVIDVEAESEPADDNF